MEKGENKEDRKWVKAQLLKWYEKKQEIERLEQLIEQKKRAVEKIDEMIHLSEQPSLMGERNRLHLLVLNAQLDLNELSDKSTLLNGGTMSVMLTLLHRPYKVVILRCSLTLCYSIIFSEEEILGMEFNTYGRLPVGDYPLTLDQLRESILVHGTQRYPVDTEWRLQLVDNLSHLVPSLWAIGITDIYIDGSFVTSKARPNDIDGYYVCDVRDLLSESLFRTLHEVSGEAIWDMRDRVQVGYDKIRPKMWKQYRCELYPHCEEVHLNFPHPPFPQFFRQTRVGVGKGIVKLIRG